MVTLALAKQHLEYSDTDRDALIQQYIDAAAAWVENYTGKLLANRATSQVVYGYTTGPVRLQFGPGPVITGVTYVDGDGAAQTVTSGDYRTISGYLYPVTSFPSAPYGLAIAYTAGYTTAPADLVSAQLLLIGHLFNAREGVSDKLGFEVPLAVEALCAPYRAVEV